MNHDASHCSDYIQGKCPPKCYRAQLTQELKDLAASGWGEHMLFSYAHFKNTQYCPRWPKKTDNE